MSLNYRCRNRTVPLVLLAAVFYGCGDDPIDPDPEGPFPTRLSELALTTGHLYEPQFPLWSNGSLKDRRAHLPAGETVDISARGVWQYPEGTVFSKTFAYQTATGGTRKIETRIIRRRDLQWETAVYLWDDQGNEATLREGDIQTPVSVTDIQGNTFDHVVPSLSDCQACHGLAPVFILGFNELQLNAPLASGGNDQLKDLETAGLFNTGIPATPAVIGGDATTEAVIGYIQGNCVHCHHPTGVFDLTYDDFLTNTVNVNSPTGNTLITPGDPLQSEIYLRFAAGSMPPVGVQLRDETARALIENWITNHNFQTPAQH